MKRVLLTTITMSIIMGTIVYGESAHPSIIKGNSTVIKSNSVYNINPYNPAKITGVGEDGIFTVLTPTGQIDLAINSPLIKISGAYNDEICFKDGSWGVLRNVGKMVLDGNENWQSMEDYRYKNDKTTIFTCPIENKILIESGMCTYFDVLTDEKQATSVYDAISVGKDNASINLRFMNVRNIKTVTALKDWLKGRADAGVPIVYYYALTQPVFEPFSAEENKKLENISLKDIRVIDKNIEYKEKKETKTETFFVNSQKLSGFMGDFVEAIKGVQVYYADTSCNFFIEGVEPGDRELVINIQNESGEIYKGKVEHKDISFMSEKTGEITFENPNDDAMIKMQVDFYNLLLPEKNESGFTYDQTGISKNCYIKEELILPSYIPVLKGDVPILHFENAIINKQDGNLDITGDNVNMLNGQAVFSGEKDEIVNMTLDGKAYKTKIAVAESKKMNARIMLLGDSLINEDKYPKYLADIFGEEAKLIGTRGQNDAKHEGRGGWTLYDYCNSDNKYGFTNPFLYKGRFDFSHYMMEQKYDGVDYVVINLGINDLNLLGHNTHEEITAHFDTIIESILKFDKTVKILINTPIMLFDQHETLTAKNERLSLIKTLNTKYEGRENENIFIAPTYILLDSYSDFKLKEPILNDENQDGRLVVTDTTHPANSGYEKIAKSTVNFIKYIEGKK